MKKCFAASSGGHMEELSRLCELADEKTDVWVVAIWRVRSADDENRNDWA